MAPNEKTYNSLRLVFGNPKRWIEKLYVTQRKLSTNSSVIHIVVF